MTPTLKLGSLAGIRVGLHWSVLGIVLILVVALAFGHLPSFVPDRSTVVYLLAGVVTAALFLASLFAHEMAHALVARREGVAVTGITLWLLGGVAQLRGEARTPGADFRIAAVGPFVSVLAGVLFGLAAWLTGSGYGASLAGAVLSYLAVINIVLAVFNLIPAAPLDGGRILRSALWAWRGDRVRATVWSARAGRVFGFALIGFGVVRIIVGPFAGGGLWSILLGLFIVNVATAEERHAEMGAALAGIRVRDVMTAEPEAADGAATVAEFLSDIAMARRHSAFPLLDSMGRLQGMITLNRLRSVAPEHRFGTRLRDVACAPDDIPRAAPDEPLSNLLSRMHGCADGRALVFADDRLVGIVTPSDISRMVALRGLDADWGAAADVTIDRARRT